MARAKAESGSYVGPDNGIHQAVCVDSIELLNQVTPWGIKDQVRLVWETDQPHPEFEGNIRISKKYTLSLHEKSNLSQDLENWRGKSFTKEERAEGFETEDLVGVPCTINVKEIEGSDGGTYKVIGAIMPPDKRSPMKPTGHYVRQRDRTENGEAKYQAPVTAPVVENPDYGFDEDDGGLPF